MQACQGHSLWPASYSAFPSVPRLPKAPVQQNHHHQEYAHLISQISWPCASVWQPPSHPDFESNRRPLNHRACPRRCLWIETPCIFDARLQACHQTVPIPIQNPASPFLPCPWLRCDRKTHTYPIFWCLIPAWRVSDSGGCIVPVPTDRHLPGTR